MDFDMAAFALRTMAVTLMLLALSLRASKIMCTDALLIAVALGMVMLASASVFAGHLTAFAWLFTGHVVSVLVLQGTYGALPFHPVRAYRRMRDHR